MEYPELSEMLQTTYWSYMGIDMKTRLKTRFWNFCQEELVLQPS